MSNSINLGKYGFRKENGNLVLEFENFNGLYKGEEEVLKFTKKLLKEVRRFKQWQAYEASLKQTELFITNS